MLDIKLFRETPEIIKADLKKRGWTEKDITVVDEVIENDRKWREKRQEGDKLKHERNVVTEEISKLKKASEDLSEKVADMKAINERIKKLDEEIETYLEKRNGLLRRIPNLMHESVPAGKDDSENVPIRQWGEPKKYDFELKSHQDIIEDLGQGDFKSPQKTSGAGFYYLYEDMVMLDYALRRFAVDFLRGQDFRVVEPPLMLRRKAMAGVVDLSDFEEVLYKLEDEDLYL
ncbi:MAG: serine--tRNA ligase, partial [Thermoplasmata archaeon]